MVGAMLSKPRYYRAIFYDDDNKCFGVSNIIISCNDLTDVTCILQRRGLNVHMSTTEPKKDINEVPSVESLIQSLKGSYTYDESMTKIICKYS